MSKTGQPSKKKLAFFKRYPQSPLQDIRDWVDACKAGDDTTVALLNPTVYTCDPPQNNEYYACIAQGYWVKQIGDPMSVSGGRSYSLAYSPMFDWYIGESHHIDGVARNMLEMRRGLDASLKSYVSDGYLDPTKPLPDEFSYRCAVSTWLRAMGISTAFPWTATGCGTLYWYNNYRYETVPIKDDSDMLMLVRIIKNVMRTPEKPCSKGIGYHKRLLDFCESKGYIDCTVGRAIRHIAEWTSF